MIIIAPEGYFAYQISKLTINLAGTGLTYLFDAKKGRQKWNNDYVAPIKGIISALTSNEVSGPEKVGLVARFGTGILVDYLLTKQLKKAYKTLLTDPRCQNLGKSLMKQLESKFAESTRIIKKITMSDVFNNSKFGKLLKIKSIKTGKRYKGSQIYKITEKVNKNLKKGYYFYLDSQHYDHIEVFDKLGKAKCVINLDGNKNINKTLKAINRTIDI